MLPAMNQLGHCAAILGICAAYLAAPGACAEAYDYVIVGGGTAGNALAARLSLGLPQTASVLLVEAGPEALDELVINVPGRKGTGLGGRYDWNFTTVAQSGLKNRVIGVNRGKVLGGTSALNLLVYDKAAEAEYDAWEKVGNAGWNWDLLSEAMTKSENYTGGPQGSGTDGPVQAVVNRIVPAHQELFIPTVTGSFDIEENEDSLQGYPIGVMFQPSSIDPTTYNRSYSTNAYLPLVDKASNLKIRTSATVTRINFERVTIKKVRYQRAKSITLSDGTTIAAKKEVILSAGVIGTPNILELSGIGQSKVLKAAGIKQLIDLPGVGENYQDHLRVQSSYQLRDNYTSFDILRYNPTFAAAELEKWLAGDVSLWDYTASGYIFANWNQIVGDDSKLKALARKAIGRSKDVGLRKKLEFLNDPTVPQVEVIFSDGYTGVKGYPASGSPLFGKGFFTLLAGLMHPLSRGTVHINTTNPLGKPIIDPRYLDNEHDIQAMVELAKLNRRIALSEPLRSAWVSEYEPGLEAVQTDAQWRDFVLNTTLSIFHPIGTAAMLPKKDGGVVDPLLKVYGTSNLRIVDASIIPVQLSAHPQTAIYGIAEIAADIILSTLRNSISCIFSMDNLIRLRAKFFPDPLPPAGAFEGQTVLITGGTTGLGLAAAIHFAALGAHIIITCRNAARGEAARATIKSATGIRDEQTVEVMQLDMNHYSSCYDFVERLKERQAPNGRHNGVDCVVLNAGCFNSQYVISPEGWEETIQVNTLSTTLLGLLLLPWLKDQSSGRKPHLVVVTSKDHLDPDIQDWPEWASQEGILRHLSRKESWPVTNPAPNAPNYPSSKLMMMYAVEELAEGALGPDGRPDVIINSVCPGLVHTDIARDIVSQSWTLYIITRLALGILAKSADYGARAYVNAAYTSADDHISEVRHDFANMRALVTTEEHTAVVQDVPVPTPAEGEILVKVHYAAQNPTDWKSVSRAPAGRIVGCDFAGTIEDSNGSSWHKGQRVAGWVHGIRADPQRGAFAEYLVTESTLVFPIPDSVSFPDAAVISLAFATAVQALFQRLGLPEPSRPAQEPIPVLIYGGATSVGVYAIQLAKLAGLRVITTGSNVELLKSFGADHVVDYKNADWPEEVRSLTEDKLLYALDCISEPATTSATAKALSSTQKSHIMTLLPRTDKDISEEDAKRVRVESTLAYSVFGRALPDSPFENTGPARPVDKKFWEKYVGLLPELLESGKIKPNVVKELGGLDDINKGFDLQREGRIRAEKLVYRIA
ncbi:putative GMC oxidoreductase [Paramyrothecium foliicola]|nr:putative GMC oxidoreductase [Paramyrothecium foliicola]